MSRHLRFLAALGAALMLAGCASNELVVVLPAADGHVGGVVVQTGDGKTVVLDKAYASDVPGDSKAGMSTADDVNKSFAEVMAARPIPPGHHQLYFINDSDEMTDPSKAEFDQKVFADVHARGAAEIVIIGHTDTTGSADHNDQLSRERAEAIKTLLLSRKSDLPQGMSITTAGRGQRDDKDPPNTANPLERYVDIIVQ
ncbi:MAG TPA: OmpA family protein [Rhizomicrobium sp.]|nr:OmpA family protein [Rhizomicrobium sp.]